MMTWYLMLILYIPTITEPTRIIVGRYESADECLSEHVIVQVPETYTWKLTCEEHTGSI